MSEVFISEPSLGSISKFVNVLIVNGAPVDGSSRDGSPGLGDHRLDVDTIAADPGYSHVANYARAFRRWTGETPSEYRNR